MEVLPEKISGVDQIKGSFDIKEGNREKLCIGTQIKNDSYAKKMIAGGAYDFL